MKKFLPSFLFIGGVAALGVAFVMPGTTEYSKKENIDQEIISTLKEEKFRITHLPTPEPLKALYMTSCIASLPVERSKMVKLIEETEANAIVIDVKDYTGVVSFTTSDPEIDKVSLSGKGCRVDDMKEFLAELYSKNIYTIARVTVFQDPLYTKMYPEVAVKSKSKKLSDGSPDVWKDRKGLAFIDVGAIKYWDHVIEIAKISHEIGFDEINFDYIRFPSDGNMEDTEYTLSESLSKREALKKFFEYLSHKMRQEKIVTSADLFGMTTTNRDDLGIGQVLEDALLNFDYVSPMVYPSHYPPNFNGWKDPNKVTYDLIYYVMSSAVARANFLRQEVLATSTVSIVNGVSTTISKTPDQFLVKRVSMHQLRPWLQDFNYPVPYTAEMVRDQIRATYDVGLTSWMLWDPANTYTKEALILE